MKEKEREKRRFSVTPCENGRPVAVTGVFPFNLLPFASPKSPEIHPLGLPSELCEAEKEND